jgi:hypothetical protein
LILSLTWVCIPETVARLTSQLEDLEAEKQQREEQLFVMREAIISILGRKYQIKPTFYYELTLHEFCCRNSKFRGVNLK